MNKFLPTTSEMRHAVFTAIALVLIIAILGFIGHIFRYTFGAYGNFGYGPRGGYMMMDDHDGMGNMMWKMKGSHNGMMMSGDEKMNMDEMMMDMSGSLEGLKGAELEQTFLDEMIVHHNGAIDMAKTLKAGTKRPELLKMADDIINTQTKEVTQMQTWLNSWFPEQK